MVKQSLTVALVKSILQVLDRVGPMELCRHRRCYRRCGQRGRRYCQLVPEGTLVLDQLHQTRGDPGARPPHQAPEKISNPRVMVTQ
jgi:hypothetical protein